MALLENKKAHFDYELLDKHEAGLELLGGEVKSLRAGQARLEGARVIIRGDEAYLVGASIAPYQPNQATNHSYDPERTRRLLVSKADIKSLIGKGEQKGLTLVPISIYNKGRYLKLSFAVARGKKKFDKRETIKKRDTDREIRRSLKTE